MGFWIGFAVGGITVPLALAVIAKPLMKWMARKELTKMSNNVMQRLGNLQTQFPVKEEEYGTEEEKNSEGKYY